MSPTTPKQNIIVDFGEAGVRTCKSPIDMPVWSGFRIWESTPWPLPTQIRLPKMPRSVNVVGSPPFDMFVTYLMDFATIAASALKRHDWWNFRRLVLVHVPSCNSKCWYCFNDAWAHDTDRSCSGDNSGVRPSRAEAYGLEDIKAVIKHFKDQQDRDRELPDSQCNVMRISGGEPFLYPELVRDLAVEFKSVADKRNAFLWIDTNLMPAKTNYDKSLMTAIRELGNRAAVHACLHGGDDTSLRRNTCTSNASFQEVIENLQLLVNAGLNVYPRINPATLTPNEAELVFHALSGIKPALPHQTYLGPIDLSYPAAKKRMAASKDRTNMGELTPSLCSSTATIFWWDKLMERRFGFGYAAVPRHFQVEPIGGDEPGALETERPDELVLLVSKGFFRDGYALKALQVLALPFGSQTEIEMETKWAEPALVEHAREFPELYKGTRVLVVATHAKKRGMHHTALIRWAEVRHVTCGPDSINFAVTIKGFPDEKLGDGTAYDNYEALSRFVGRNNLPLNGYFLQLVGLPGNLAGDDVGADGFSRAVNWLRMEEERESLKRSIFYHVARIMATAWGSKQRKPVRFESSGETVLYPGESIDVSIVTLNPMLGSPMLPENEAVLRVSCSGDEIELLTSEEIRLSKFGRHVIRLRVPMTLNALSGILVIGRARGSLLVPEVRIPFRVRPPGLD